MIENLPVRIALNTLARAAVPRRTRVNCIRSLVFTRFSAGMNPRKESEKTGEPVKLSSVIFAYECS